MALLWARWEFQFTLFFLFFLAFKAFSVQFTARDKNSEMEESMGTPGQRETSMEESPHQSLVDYFADVDKEELVFSSDEDEDKDEVQKPDVVRHKDQVQKPIGGSTANVDVRKEAKDPQLDPSAHNRCIAKTSHDAVAASDNKSRETGSSAAKFQQSSSSSGPQPEGPSKTTPVDKKEKDLGEFAFDDEDDGSEDACSSSVNLLSPAMPVLATTQLRKKARTVPRVEPINGDQVLLCGIVLHADQLAS